MAIVDGKRIPGLWFYKYKGRKEWCAIHHPTRHSDPREPTWMYSLPIEVDTDKDPRLTRWHYCSPVSQPAMLEANEVKISQPDGTTASSWRRMPGGWRAAFRYLFTRLELIEAPSPTIERRKIEKLRHEARGAGDAAQVDICQLALECNDPFMRQVCQHVIGAADAMKDEEDK